MAGAAEPANRFAAISLCTERLKGAEGHFFFAFCASGRKMPPPFWTNGPFGGVSGVKCWMNEMNVLMIQYLLF